MSGDRAWPGPLPPDGELARWLANLSPDSPAFAATSRAAIFLLAFHQRARESFYGELCDAVLPPDLRIDSALDVGCGAGNLALELAGRLRVPVTGIDSDSWLLLWARRVASGEPFEFPVRLDAARFGVARMEACTLPAPVSVVSADLFAPPFRPSSFGLVTLVNVLDSVPDPARALRQAVELLEPGGYLLFASPDSWNTGTTPLKRWLATTPAEWDLAFSNEGLETITRADDLEWHLKDTPRLHHLYRVHARLLRKL